MGNGVSLDWRTRGNTEFVKGNYSDAIHLYTKAIEADPHDHRLYSNRSASRLKLRSFALALQDAQIAIALQPSWAKGYYRAGLALAALNRPRDAVDCLRRAQGLDPANATVGRKIAEIEAASDDALHVATGRGSLYTWGIGKQGVLGLGDESDRPSAKAVPVFRGKQVVDVSCGLLHAVAVTVTGEVWSWGGNGQGQCGMGHLELLTTPHVVPALLGRRVHAVACGGAHTVVLTQRGEAWSWGLGGQGQLGHGDHEPRMSPTPITYFTKHGVQACAVSCGMGHSIVLDSTRRKAFAFGWNNQGQLGLGHVNPVATPTAVPPMGVIQHVACGGGHTCMVTEDGALYTTGGGSCGQLGHGPDVMALKRFQRVQALLSTPVALAACGEEFTCIVTAHRAVMTFGLGNVGQLGISALANADVPTLVESMSGKQVEMVACSMSQVVAITRSGEVYSWGLPTDAMGTPSDDLAVPKRLSMLRRQKVLRLECGRRFYCAVVSGVSAGHCVMDGVPSTCAAGTRVKATLTARDMFEEPLTRGGDKFNVSLIHDWDDSVAVKVAVDDNMDGTYDCTFRVAVVGSYTLYVSCGGTYIIGSPFHIDVVSTGVDVDASEVYVMTVDDGWQSVTSAGSPTLPVQAGTPVHFGVELKDSCGNLCHSDESLAQLCGLAQGVSCPNVIVEPVTDGDTATTLRATSLAKDASQAQRDAATEASDDGGGRGSAKTDGAGIASLGAGSVVAPTLAAALGASGSFASAGVFSGVLAAGTFGTDVAAQAAASVGGDAGEGAGGGAGAGAGAGAGMARAGANTPVVMNTTSVAALEDRQARVDDAVQMASKPLAVVTNEGLWRQIEASRRPVRATVVFNVCGEHTVTFRLSDGSPVAHSPFSFMVSPARAHAKYCIVHAVGHGEHAGQLLGARRQHTVAAGDKFRLLVSCFDQFGNRTSTGAHVEAALKGPDELTCRVFPLGSPEGREAVRDAEARRHSDKGSEWVVECGPVTAGSHRLRISMDGAELPGSPFMLDVEPGVADPLFSSVSRESAAVDGEPDPPTTTEDLDGGEWVVWIRDSIAHRSVLLQPRDAWGNACRTSAAHVTAQLQRVRDGVVSTAPGVVEVEPLDSGCVRVVYGVDQPGRYFLTVRMSGTVLPGCPMKFAAKYHPSEVARREIAELARAQEGAEKLRQEEARRVEAGTSGDACLEEAEALSLLEEQQRRQREALQAQQEARKLEEQRAKEEEEQRRAERERQRKEKAQARRDQAAQLARSAAAAESRRLVMARLRKEEMTRRRAEEALARAQRERANEEARKRRAKSVKRTGGGFVVKFDQA